jgi:hypothetical protein
VAVVIPVRGKSRKILASEKEMRFCQGDALCCLNITIAGISSWFVYWIVNVQAERSPLIWKHLVFSLHDLCHFGMNDWTQTMTTGLRSVVFIGDSNSGISPVSLSQLLVSKLGSSFDLTSYSCSREAHQKNNHCFAWIADWLLLVAFGFLDDALGRVDTRGGIADTGENSGSTCWKVPAYRAAFVTKLLSTLATRS